MTHIDLKRFEREVEEAPAIIWPETPVNPQEERLYRPPFEYVKKAVENGSELIIHVIEPKESEIVGTPECFEMTHHQVARAVGVRVHVLFEIREAAAHYGGILPDGTPVSFIWNGDNLE